MSRFIPLSVPNLKGNELRYVSTAVETEWVSTAGRFVAAFEDGIAHYVGVDQAVSCQNGTAGLHTALLVCGVTSSDMVIVPTLSFIATVNPVKYIGAQPVFMDCDDSLCMDPVKLEAFCASECKLCDGILYHKQTGKRIPAVIVAHIFGNMADIVAIQDVCHRYHLQLIEDAAEALGTCYISGPLKGGSAGTFGDVGVYSFNGNKIITTGGGGMIVSKDPNKLAHCKHLTTQAKSDELYYTHDEVGFNYRLTNLQAALGLAQLEQLDGFIEIKNRNYALYQEGIDSIPGIRLLNVREGIRSNRWFYALYCEDNCAVNRDSMIVKLSEMGVQTRPIWGLIHQQVPYQADPTYCIEKAIDYWKHVVNIPCSTNLTEEDVQYVLDCIGTIAGIK